MYLSTADADAYFASRLYSEVWEGVDAATKDTALAHASRLLDSLRYIGYPLEEDQEHAFPRCYWQPARGEDRPLHHVVNTSGRYGAGYARGGYVCEEGIPQAVRDAACEEALSLLEQGDDSRQRARLQAEGVTSMKLGSLSESYATGRKHLLSADAERLLGPYLRTSVRIV